MSRLPLVLLLCTACSPSDPFSPSGRPGTSGPPPGVFELRAEHPVDGVDIALTVTTDAGAGHTVYFGWGSPGSSTCPPALSGACLSLLDPILLGTADTDPAGVAELTLTTLEGWVGREASVQAVWLNGPAPATLSNAATATVLSELGDADLDGLTNAAELDAHTRPTVADTDGGGVRDGQEVAQGTDPLQAGDDGTAETLCHNGVDDDGDGRSDCRDADCSCPEIACDDGLDDDGDGLIDCADDDCSSTRSCPELTCANGIDDDGDGLVDCEDADCLDAAACTELDCADGIDDDGDGVVDCEDDDCWSADCHDAVVAWVTSGRGDLRQSGGPDVARDMVGVTGKVYVAGGPAGPTVCDWSRPPRGEDIEVDPACKLGSRFLPPTDQFVMRPGQGLFTPSGALWYPTASTYQGNYSSTYHYVHNVRGTEPLVRCPAGTTATRFWADEDGDGFATPTTGDLNGDIAVPIWTCGAQPAGTSVQRGDCDDSDPTWTPATVTLPPGVQCSSVRSDDRDGDGRIAAPFGGTDTNDSDGSL